MVELLVSLLVATILMLIVGAISSISLSSHNKVRKESELFGDLAYGLKVIQKKVRETGDLSSGGQGACPNTGCLWADQDQLIIDNIGSDNEALGFYNATATRVELITVPYTGEFSLVTRAHVDDNKDVIMAFDRNNDIMKFDFDFNTDFSADQDCDNAPAGTALGSRTVALCWEGDREDIPFKLVAQIQRRAQ